METFALAGGELLPKLGFGVYDIAPSATCRTVCDAVEAGYRHIDTAAYYHNEEQTGEAVRQCGLPREALFVTSKVYGAQSAADAEHRISASLLRLNTGYLDLMLIHWPEGGDWLLWKALENHVRKGDIRAIGLSNFYGAALEQIRQTAEIPPAVNQIECHVYRAKEACRRAWAGMGIQTVAWSPLAAARSPLTADPVLTEIGRRFGKTAAQVALRSLIQRGIAVIPKTVHKARMIENADIFDFTLTEADMRAIAALDRNRSVWGWYD